MKRYRQIILHAGLSKTGSTSIQNHCLRYRPLLQQRGINYPVFTFADKPFDNHSIALITAVARDPGQYGLGLGRQFGVDADRVAPDCRGQLEALLVSPGGDSLVLSSERIAGLDPGDMRALRERLEPHTGKLRLIVYIRSPQSALESILQERVKAGAVVEPQDIAGRVRRRYEALEACFADVLESINYHEALDCPGGVVGSFLSQLGIPEKDIQSMSFQADNVRLSLEAFMLMDAVNRCYPRRGEQEHGVFRTTGDMDPLLALPGQPFRIPDFVDSKLHEATLEEARWLESRLGFRFPAIERVGPEPLWPPEALARLEELVMQIGNPDIRRLLAKEISAQAGLLAATRPVTAEALDAIAGHLG